MISNLNSVSRTTSSTSEANEVLVYIHSSYANPFRSGWGAVIDSQGVLQELGATDTEGASDMRLLLVACLAALHAVSMDDPLRVFCSSEYLTRWTLPRLGEMRADGFKTARKKKIPNLDLIEELSTMIEGRASVASVTIKSAEWDENHKRAEALALEYGAGVNGDWKARDYRRTKGRYKAEPASRMPSIQMVTSIKPGEPVDLPWD